MQLPDKKLDWPIAWSAVEEIARSEGCRLKAYRCPAGQWTVAWGHTEGVRPGDTMTQVQADETLRIDLSIFAESVKSMLTRQASDNELGAMVSLAYNIGLAGFRKSTVLRKHNEGDLQSAARAFGLWNKSKGQVLAGLTARRAREAALYLTPDGDESLPMPQSVDSEKSVAVSRSVIGGVVAGAATVAGVAAGTEFPVTAQDAQVVAGVASAFGLTALSAVLPHVVALAGVAYSIWARIDDRNKGLR